MLQTEIGFVHEDLGNLELLVEDDYCLKPLSSFRCRSCAYSHFDRKATLDHFAYFVDMIVVEAVTVVAVHDYNVAYDYPQKYRLES